MVQTSLFMELLSTEIIKLFTKSRKTRKETQIKHNSATYKASQWTDNFGHEEKYIQGVGGECGVNLQPQLAPQTGWG